MRILRVVDISIKTLAINLLAMSAFSTPAIAQSFDYPADSPTLFNRGTKQASPTATQPSASTGYPRASFPSAHGLKPDAPAQPTIFSKLFSRKSKSTEPIFRSPLQKNASSIAPSYGAGKSVYIDPNAQKLIHQHESQISQVGGYEPINPNNQFDNKPHSILEFSEANRGKPLPRTAISPAPAPAPAPAPTNNDSASPQRLVKERKQSSPNPRLRWPNEFHYRATPSSKSLTKPTATSIRPSRRTKIPQHGSRKQVMRLKN